MTEHLTKDQFLTKVFNYEKNKDWKFEGDIPCVIDFYADWCGWCKRLDQDTYVDADVMSKAKKFISLKIDADVETDLASKYGVQGLPTILFIDHKGEEVHRVVGYRRPDQFLDEMDLALRAFHGEQGT